MTVETMSSASRATERCARSSEELLTQRHQSGRESGGVTAVCVANRHRTEVAPAFGVGCQAIVGLSCPAPEAPDVVADSGVVRAGDAPIPARIRNTPLARSVAPHVAEQVGGRLFWGTVWAWRGER